MANTNKMTKKDYFAALRSIVEVATPAPANKGDILTFIDHEVELLDKKSDKSKETNTQKANAVIINTIIDVLAEQEKPVTITELMADERLATYVEETKDGSKTIIMSNQKLSSLVKKLVDAKEVVKTYDKKRAYFSLPVEEEEEEEDAEVVEEQEEDGSVEENDAEVAEKQEENSSAEQEEEVVEE